MKICTWNINSIRTRLDLLLNLIKSEQIDAILLQETKCSDKDYPISFFEENNLNTIFFGQKSYNGVAIVSKHKIEKTKIIEHETPYQNARYIEGIINFNNIPVNIASIYVPNGDDIHNDITQSPRFQFKLKFLQNLYEYIAQKQENYFICGGDYNIAKTKLDIFSHKTAYGHAGFHPDEHKSLEKIDSILIDTFRHLDKSSSGYTWYDYRHQRWQQKQGWRIDYNYVSKNLESKINKSYTLDYIRNEIKTSDHVPLVLELNI